MRAWLLPFGDYEWCKGELLRLIRRYSSDDGVPEDIIFSFAYSGTFGSDRATWFSRTIASKTLIIRRSIDDLCTDTLIEPVPGRTSATGRRFFREVNPLDAIVRAVEIDTNDR